MKPLALQHLLIRFFKQAGMPVRLTADGVIGPETREAIILAKLAAGWRPQYATGKRTIALYGALRTGGKSMLPVQRRRGLEFRDAFRERKDARSRARRLCWHPRVRYAFSSPTGGTARKGLMQFAATGSAHCAATGRDTKISASLLAFLEDAANAVPAGGVLFLNCIVNGRHRDGSRHYTGTAADIDRASDQDALGRLEQLAARHDIGILWEDAYHVHAYDGDSP